MTELTAALTKGDDGTVSITINGVTLDGFSVVRRDDAGAELRRTSTGIVERVVVASGPEGKPAAVLDLSHPDAWVPPPPEPETSTAEGTAEPAPAEQDPPAVEPSPAPAKPSRRGASTAAETVITDPPPAPAAD